MPTPLVIDVQVVEQEHPAPRPFVLVVGGGGGGDGGISGVARLGAAGPRFRRADDGGGGRRPMMEAATLGGRD